MFIALHHQHRQKAKSISTYLYTFNVTSTCMSNVINDYKIYELSRAWRQLAKELGFLW
jgi:hypothetical protein